MAQVELDRRVVGPLEPVHAELGPKEPLAGGHAVLVGHAQHEQGAVAEEHQLAAWAKEASRLGNPQVWVGPDGGAVLADGQVERSVAERDLLGRRPYQRERDAELPLQLPGDRQLPGGRVEADGPCTAARQPGRHVRSPAPKLDGVEPVELVRKKPCHRLGNAEDPPARLLRRPLPAAQQQLVLPSLFPRLDVGPEVLDRLCWHRAEGSYFTAPRSSRRCF